MTREDIIFILSSATASVQQKMDAQAALAAYAPAETVSIFQEVAERMAAPAEEPLPFEPTEVLAADEAPITSPTAQPETVPACLNLQDVSDWPDEIIPEDELWSYYGENGVGDAKLYNRLNRWRVVFVRYWQRFLVWQGHHWTEDHYNVAAQRVEAVVAQYTVLLESQKRQLDDCTDKDERASLSGRIESLRRRIKALRSNAGVKGLLEQVATVHNPLVVLPEEIDTDPYKLPCSNGVINMKTGDFRDGRPQDWLFVECATPFDPALLEKEDPCPETNKFLLASMNGDQELVDFIWRILGYGIIRTRPDHCFIIFWGPHGRNGKDTLIKLITKVLGRALSGNINVEMFLQSNQLKNSSAPSPDVMALKGMAIGWLNETEEGQRFAMSKLKQYTGGGLITGRGLMDKQQTTFVQTHLPIMCTNELPKARADDDAFWARIHVIRWELSFVDDPKEDYQRPADKDLDRKLEAELQGVLARLVRGALEYVRDGLNVPEKVKAWNDDVRNSYDDVAEFLNECCERESKRDNNEAYVTRIRASELYAAWALWFAENRDKRHIPGGKALGSMLDKREVPKTRSNGTYRLGLCLKDEWARRVEENGRDRKDKSTYVHDDF